MHLNDLSILRSIQNRVPLLRVNLFNNTYFYIGFISVFYISTLTTAAAKHSVLDTLKRADIDHVVVVGNAQQRELSSSTLSIDIVDQKRLSEHFSGNLMKSLEHIAGVQSMSVGSGFSKPMIRGMGFNRVAVFESRRVNNGAPITA